jgi:flagellar biosynthesis chaperone FliJ
MPRNSLKTLQQLRKMQVDKASAELVRLENSADKARWAERAATAVIQTEMSAASRLSADDGAVEAFGAWLPVGRAAVARAQALLSLSEQNALQARAVLTLARAGAEAVDKLMAERAVLENEEANRKQQAVIDESAARVSTHKHSNNQA